MHQIDSVFHRHRNVTILVAVLFAQVLGLAVQVRRQTDTGTSARLVRVWAAALVTPLEKFFIAVEHGVANAWHEYLYLRGVQRENADLKQQLEDLRIEQARLREDAGQARRLQSLLAFKQQFISQTLAAQVIGTSGSDQSRLIFLDKGTKDGVERGAAAITPDGIVGKVLMTTDHTSQVMLISDQLSGIGAMLQKSRLQGVVRGSPSGALLLRNIMNDENVEVGDLVLSSGGDHVFPKGMPIGVVKSVSKGLDLFYNIELKPAANLGRLEEVLVITKLDDKAPKDWDTNGPVRAADVRADRLPTVPPAARTDANGIPLPTSNLPAPGSTAAHPKAGTSATQVAAKPGTPPMTTANAPSGASTAEGTPKSAAQAASAKPKVARQVAVPPSGSNAETTIPQAEAGSATTSSGSVQDTTKPPARESNSESAVPVMKSGETPADSAAQPAAKPKRIIDDTQPATTPDANSPKPPKPAPQSSTPSNPQRGGR